MAENMVYNGIKFYLKNNYWKETRPGGKYLHRYIYESANGDIKKGCVVHHKDMNPLNNDISNLEMMTRSEHKKFHAKYITDETRERLSKALLGHKVSEETRTKIGNANRGQVRPKTKEACKNIAKALSKKTRCIELDIIFPSAKTAAHLMGFDSRKITSVCRGERKTHKGYSWEYIKGATA
jgi:hypothetical protein